MSEAGIMWTIWAAIAATDVVVVIYFIRTMRWKRGNHG